jgi:hypothetical protein
MSDNINAFVAGPRIRVEGSAGGPLTGLSFGAKDLFDVAGVRTGGGNHDWARANPVPMKHTWAVQTLLDAGATLIGKTITDEISLGILGENAFDGTPLNSAAPDRCRAAPRQALPPPSRPACATRHWAPTRAALFAYRPVSAASMASGRRMDG